MTLGDFHGNESRSAGMTETEDRLRALLGEGRHVEFFEVAVRSRLNILISGATESGKTTLAKGRIQLFRRRSGPLTIEDTRELVVPHRNVVHMTYSYSSVHLI